MNHFLTLEGLREQAGAWEAELGSWVGQLGGHVKRAEARERVGAYLRGLLGEVERRNSWQLSEYQGEAHPYGFQHLLNRARWDEQGVRDAVRQRVYEVLKDAAGVLVVDETGFIKKGIHSAGVKRQYSGTAGRIENAQIGVFLGYASCWGQGLLDRALFVPREWSEDRARCRRAGIPDEVVHQPKTELARQMLVRALDSGVSARWVTADALYGDDFRLRWMLEERGQGYVLAVSRKAYVWQGCKQRKVGELLEALRGDAQARWSRLSAGAGSQGPREYDWTCLAVNPPPFEGWQRAVLVRRSLDSEQEMQAFFIFAPNGTELADLALAAGARWNIERCFQESKSQLGLDQYEVRTWTGWHRHITLVMAAYALLVTLRRHQLKKNLLLSLGGQCPWPSLWPSCDGGCVSLPSPGDAEGLNRRYSGAAGVGYTNASLSSTTG
ncbi:IS701 family transposase [Nitrococcus mobilis]|uniref:Putative IS4 family transposase n=1 Tax=Nitrococcus mobilis Nb-231 TaxID=314278 RepID=A4BPG8_9GAMM|nr:IS701 family transposase [Nitrococcus mobilis]EAR21292.1 putative IS4 family transposase [Nitrococcus mobilis Nb-231]EAR22469.1 putative IS4 family transposase [Nitrococcus mobilis Nb-231]